jgi:hypothetical protein
MRITIMAINYTWDVSTVDATPQEVVDAYNV